MILIVKRKFTLLLMSHVIPHKKRDYTFDKNIIEMADTERYQRLPFA